jgi:hypothetical protein
MPLHVIHWTEPTTKAERAAIKAEQEQWRALEKRAVDLELLLAEWVEWYAALQHIHQPTTDAIIRGDIKWPRPAPSEQSLPARTISLIGHKKEGSIS